MAAALAYFTIFALPGMVAVALWILASALGEGPAREGLVSEVERLAGADAAAALRSVVEHATAPGSGGIVRGTISVLGVALGATGAFLELQSVLNAVWHAGAARRRMGFGELVRKRLLSFAMVSGVAVLLLALLLLDTALSLAGHALADRGLESVALPLLRVLEVALSVGALTLAFAGVYRLLPDCHVRWRDVWLGAALAAGALTLAKVPLVVWLSHGDASTAYGASGSLVVLAFTVYVGCLLFLLGAVVTRVRARCAPA